MTRERREKAKNSTVVFSPSDFVDLRLQSSAIMLEEEGIHPWSAKEGGNPHYPSSNKRQPTNYSYHPLSQSTGKKFF